MENDVLTVATIYKEGDGFTEEYVTRLEKNVAEHMHAPYNFEVVLPTRELPPNTKGFWIKTELFKKGRFSGPVVFLDLDMIIVDDVTEMFTYGHKFTMATNWAKNPGPNSTFMAWHGKTDLSNLDTVVTKELVGKYLGSGSQLWMYRNVKLPVTFIDELFPNSIVSYKMHVQNKQLPPDAKIVAFHGRPRPHEVDWKLP